MNIFFSYPHDDNAGFVKRLKQDLEARGHTVWFDEAEIKTGDDWRSKITRGILESQTVVAFLSKWAVRDPGVCLNEISIALAEKGDEAIVTVLVEPEKDVSAPVSITHIQWLRMEDHASQSIDEGWYRTHFDRLVEVIEHPSSATRHDELGTLKDVLHPLSFNADIASHLPRFTGRQWLVARYEDWLSKPSPGNANKVFRIEGGPGMGKTAVASYLAHATKSSVLGVHLCKSSSAITHNPGQLVLSLAYQMATRLPDYRARLLKVPCIKNPELMKDEDAGSLWDMLISEPLAGAGKAGLINRQRLAIVIDGLDEATRNGQNPIVELLVDHIQTLPSWVGVVLTGRPDPELTQSLKHYTPQVINGDDPANVEDLRHYIDAWLQDEVQAKRLHANKVSAAAAMLLQKSEGAFLYLAQAREEALQSNADGSSSFDLSNPASLPSGLNALYQKSFRRRFPDVQTDPDSPTSRWNALVKPLLGFILASPEPLPLDLARELMGWDSDPTGNEKQHKALQALGSLVKRTGHTEQPETCTLAPFHNSVREWLTSENSQGFRVFAEESLYPLTEATWKRYMRNEENDAYAWQVLPDLLPKLSQEKQDTLLDEPNWDTSQVLYRLADSMAPKLRYTEAAACWTVQVRFSERLSHSAPENAEFARDLWVSHNQLGDMQQALGNSQAALLLYQQGLEIAEHLSRSAPENADFARDLGASCRKLGETQQVQGNSQVAFSLYQRGLEIAQRLANSAPENAQFARDLGASYNNLGDMQQALGNSQTALLLYQQGLEIAERLARIAPENAEFAGDLCVSYSQLGDMQQALGSSQAALFLYQQGLEIAERLARSAPENAQFAHNLSVSYNNLGDMQQALGNSRAALARYQQGLEIRERLARSAPENAQFARDLSISYDKLGDMQQALGNSQAALARYQQGLEIRERLSHSAPENADFARGLSVSYNKLGDMLQALGNSQAALARYQQCLEIRESFSHSAPENAEFARDLSVSYSKLGNMQQSLGNNRAAMALHHKQQEIAERLSRSAPENAEFARDLSVSYSKLGDMQQSLGNNRAAMALHHKQQEIAERLSRSAPENAEFARDLSISYSKLGDMQQALGNSQAALALYQQGLEIREHFSRSAPQNTQFARDLSISYDQLGSMQEALGNSQAALARYQQSLDIRERLARSAPENAQFARDLSISYDKLGDMQQALGNSQAALALYQQGLEIAQRLSNSAPENADFARDLSVSYNKLGNVQQVLDNSQAALALYQQGLEIREHLSNSAPDNAMFSRDLSFSYDRLGDMQQALGNSQAALARYQQGLEIRERLSNSAPENAQFARDLSISYEKLGNMQQALGNSQAALALYQQGLEIAQRLSNSAPENAQFARDLWVSYWRLASMTAGEEQMGWWRKILAALTSMQARGTLPKSDEQFSEAVKTKLGIK